MIYCVDKWCSSDMVISCVWMRVCVVVQIKTFSLRQIPLLKENFRRGKPPTGIEMRIIYVFNGVCARHWMSPTRIYVKIDYIFSLLPQTICLGKIYGPRYLGPKLTKSAIFSLVFSVFRIKLWKYYFKIKFLLT